MEPVIQKGERDLGDSQQPDEVMPEDLEALANTLPGAENSLVAAAGMQIPADASSMDQTEHYDRPLGLSDLLSPEDFNETDPMNQSMEETPHSSTAGDGSPSDEPEIPTSDEIEPQSSGEPATGPSGEEDLPEIRESSQFATDFIPITSIEDAPAQPEPKKVALVLSGGGARGAFQVGAEKYARDVKGYQWDIIAGVSVGAMNGAMLAMHRYSRLLQIWDHISNDQVYTGGFNIVALIKIMFGAKSFYGNGPLQKLMQEEFEAGQVLDELRVGAVSLVSGEYVQFTRESLELARAILASASIPVVWPPVEISADYPAMVDGGVRNLTPIGDVLDLEPDEIVIINCGNERPLFAPDAGANVLSVGMRALDIMQNEIFVNDMKEFLRINELVKQASEQGAVLHNPKTGQPYKYYPYQVIEPDSELGEVLDFSRKSVQASLRAGVRRAREVLGRP